MRKPIITQQISSTRYLPLKTINFQIDHISSKKKILHRPSTQRPESSRMKTTGIGKNLQIVMKLSEIYTSPHQFVQSINLALSSSQNLSPFRKSQKFSPKKCIQIKSGLFKLQKKQNSKEKNINLSPAKQNNYKYFPKRQVKLKNNNPYKFYMFNHKNCQKHSFSERISVKGFRNNQIRVQNVYTLSRDNSIPRRTQSVQIKRRKQTPYFQPWISNKQEGKDDSIIFQKD